MGGAQTGPGNGAPMNIYNALERSQDAAIERLDAEAVNSAKVRRPLYEKRKKIFPKRAEGRFRRFKWIVMLITLGIYYLTPWIRWDRGPDHPSQAVLVDMANGRLYVFFFEIWPQEVYFLTGLLVLGAIGLFAATSLFGRVWCGFACPQTVWTDLFMWVERVIQGDRNERMKLDKAPWTAGKLRKKALTHAAWVAIAAAGKIRSPSSIPSVTCAATNLARSRGVEKWPPAACRLASAFANGTRRKPSPGTIECGIASRSGSTVETRAVVCAIPSGSSTSLRTTSFQPCPSRGSRTRPRML